jgi:hypothetical protein
MGNLSGVVGAGAQGITSAIKGKRRVQFIQSNQSVIQIDATVSESHVREVQPSEFPIENGQVISDHLIVRPASLEITGVISDFPIGGGQGLVTEAATSVASSLIPPAGLAAIAGAVGLISAGAASPSIQAYLKLVQLQKSGQPVDVLTTLERYPNMWIKTITVPRDAASGRILLFTLSMVQLLLVAPQSVNVQIFANPALSANNADVGSQSNGIPNGFQAGLNQFNSTAAAISAKLPGGIGG